MNLLKKIKSKNLIRVLLTSFFALSSPQILANANQSMVSKDLAGSSMTGSSIAMTLPSQSSTIQPPHQNEQSLPPGYQKMITDYGDVRDMMVSQLPQNNQIWRQWMSPGLNRNDSLYWWLLAQWHHQNSDADNAYRAATVAMLLSKMDLAVCGIGTKYQQDAEGRLLSMHPFALTTPDQNVIKRAIADAVLTAERMNKNGQRTSGMACFWHRYDEYRRKPELIGYQTEMSLALVGTESSFVNIQKDVIERFKKQHGYRIIWQEMSLEDIYQKQTQ